MKELKLRKSSAWDIQIHVLKKTSHLNPFTAPACKISGLKSAHSHTHTCKQYFFSGPVTHPLSLSVFWCKPFHMLMWRRKTGFKDSKLQCLPVGFEWQCGEGGSEKGKYVYFIYFLHLLLPQMILLFNSVPGIRDTLYIYIKRGVVSFWWSFLKSFP